VGENLEEEKPRGERPPVTVNSRSWSGTDSHMEQSLEGGAEEAGASGQLLVGELRETDEKAKLERRASAPV
jgi:hypothetical protein